MRTRSSGPESQTLHQLSSSWLKQWRQEEMAQEALDKVVKLSRSTTVAIAHRARLAPVPIRCAELSCCGGRLRTRTRGVLPGRLPNASVCLGLSIRLPRRVPRLRQRTLVLRSTRPSAKLEADRAQSPEFDPVLPERQALIYADNRPRGLDLALSAVADGRAPSREMSWRGRRSRGVVVDELGARARRRRKRRPVWRLWWRRVAAANASRI